MQAAEDAWNSRGPERVALAYTEVWVSRNRDLNHDAAGQWWGW